MRILRVSSAAALAAAFIALSPLPVFAGLFDSAASSYQQQSRVVGRHLVAVPPGYEPGSIYVQFSRARLYYVLPNQRPSAIRSRSPWARRDGPATLMSAKSG